jgi:hypothetical protein
VREVPYDPHLPFLFFGEEISMAVRMWTRGWDLFAPDGHVVFHRWARAYRSTFWEVPGGAELKRRSQQRVRRLLTGEPLAAAAPPHAPNQAHRGSEAAADTDGAAASAASFAPPADAPPADAPVWGVGSARSLRAYERLAGVEFGAKRVSPLAERGGLPSERWFWGAALEG